MDRATKAGRMGVRNTATVVVQAAVMFLIWEDLLARFFLPSEEPSAVCIP